VRYLWKGLTVMTRKPCTVPADGETMGEIIFRGNITMKGYLKNPAASQKASPAAGSIQYCMRMGTSDPGPLKGTSSSQAARTSPRWK
jgi:acyl-CoA synthetase (AMP-forming)/AMP-acid ligase II